MIEQGKYSTVKLVNDAVKGCVLADADDDRIFLPDTEIEGQLINDKEYRVFAYKNNKGDLTASLNSANILVNQVGYLKVVGNSNFGSFLDWGIPKDLLVPFKEQYRPMEEDGWYLVYCYLDDQTNRLAATSKLDHYLDQHKDELKTGDRVEIFIGEESDLGVNVIVNHKYKGLLFNNEIFKDLHYGDYMEAFVKNVREDGKLDIALQQSRYNNIDPNAEIILNKLKSEDGFLDLTDKSAPQDIYDNLEMSKKAFKRALGSLYKKHLVRIEEDGVYLVVED